MTDKHTPDLTDEVEGAQNSQGTPGVPTLDVEKYREFVDEFDLTEERKIELLQTLWSMMSFFVQHGFGVDSIHRFIPALAEISSERDPDDVEKGSREHFNGTAMKGEDD